MNRHHSSLSRVGPLGPSHPSNLVCLGRHEEARRLCLAAANFDPQLDLNHPFVRRAVLGAAGHLP